MVLQQIIDDVADSLKAIDSSEPPFKSFQRGIGPYGEPQMVRLVADYLTKLPPYHLGVKTMRTPDLLVKGEWAVEVKLARPYGDNGKLAENWSVNLLHPYPGNASLLGDCLKLQSYECPERKAVLAIGYEHDPPQVDLEPLFRSFELIAKDVLAIRLGERISAFRSGLIHPVHQRLVVVGWTIW
jgi:hypothetical protein